MAKRYATQRKVVVVGAANLDIIGFSDNSLIPRDSNPGRVRFFPGGVGRNIAENLSRLNVPTSLITAVGGGFDGQYIEDSCKDSGICTSHILHMENTAVSAYLAILNPEGDMVMAISDTNSAASITPSMLRERKSLLNSAALIVADANIPGDSLQYLASTHRKKPLIVDPVSVSKAKKLKPILKSIHTLKMNRLEASALVGRQLKSTEDLRYAGIFFSEHGVKNIFITLGEDGVYGKNSMNFKEEGIYRSDITVPVNATGAGDAFTAGIVYAVLAEFPIESAFAHASAAARIALSCESAVNPLMSRELLRKFLVEGVNTERIQQ